MKKIELEKIDRRELLRYLGYNGVEKVDENIEREIEYSSGALLDALNVRYIYVCRTISEIEKAGLLEGEDIKKHLFGCDSVIVLALTIGGEVENIIRASYAFDALRPVVLDACASVAVEMAADKCTDELKKEYEKQSLYLTDRFSPGYGDFPIEKQHILLNIVDASRKIGLCATKSSILTPRKSITALIGVSQSETKGKKAGCENCALKDKCEYRRKGKACNV